MTGLAVLAAMLGVWLVVLGPGPGSQRLAARERRTRRVVSPWRVAALLASGACVVGVGIGWLALVGVGGLLGVTVGWVVATRLRGRRALKRTREVARAAQVFESLMALGHVPGTALALAAEECPVLAPARADQRMGGQPWEVLEHLAATPGSEGLAEIAHAWRVAQVSGASMRESLERVRRNLDEAADTAAIVAGELAGSRATGQLMALLPLVGLAMAAMIGADPFHFLTGGVLGRACLVGGIGLACSGVMWTEVIGTRVARPKEAP
ncbi:MAG: pilus assembly protein TadB [Propionibacteriaceae bacterium]|jgi:tight adherence protein B|nr:pilus assembly protein TadB [Propionibacteriaceae bacterium]